MKTKNRAVCPTGVLRLETRIPRVVTTVALLICLTSCIGNSPTANSSGAESPDQGFSNPVFVGNFPDPQIVATSTGYVAVATNGNGMNVQTLTSTDMVHWDQGADALPHVASWSTPGKVWAPEISAWDDGTFRLYYTTRGPNERQCISVASAPEASGPFVDTSTKPLICEDEEGGSIDPSPFLAPDGSRWLYWKNDGNAIGVDTWIRVQRLDKDGLTLIGHPTNLIKQNLPWEGSLVEAPVMVFVDGRYHLFYSANDYASDRYAVGHAVGSSPTGPFSKDPRPVLASNDVASGPGHCQLIKVGEQWWMVYHAWKPDAIGDESSGRRMWLSPVSFTAESVTVVPPTAHLLTSPGTTP